MKIKLNSLKFKGTAIIIIVYFICLLLSSVISFNICEKILYDQFNQKASISCSNVSNNINNWIEGQGKAIEQMAEDIQFYNNFDATNMKDYLHMKQQSQKYVIAYYVGLSDKRYFGSDNWIPPQGYDVTKQKWYSQAVNENKLVYTKPYIDEATKKSIISILMPIKIDGKIVGVIGEDLYLDYLMNITQKYKIGENDYVFLVDADNDFIIHKNKNFLPSSNKNVNMGSVKNYTYTSIANKSKNESKGLIKGKDYDSQNKYFVYDKISSTGWLLVLSIPEIEIIKPLSKLILGFISSFIISIIISSLISIYIINRILKAIFRFKEQTKLLADGDYRETLDIKAKDEIGDLVGSFNTMITKQQKFIKNVKQMIYNLQTENDESDKSICEVTETSKIVTDSMEEISNGSVEQAKNMTITLEKVNSLGKSINNIDSNVRSMVNETNKSKDKNELGLTAARELKAKFEENNNSIRVMSEKVKDLTEKFKYLEDINQVIESISKETNLLSLNASIEAVKVGDAGKGFGVVADEIRKLSNDSSDSSKKIKSAINEIDDIINLVKVQMANTTAISESTNVKLKSTINNFEDVISCSNNLIRQINLLNDETDNMRKSKIEVIENMENVSNISEQQSAASEEVSASMQEQFASMEKISNNIRKINNMSKKLLETIQLFKT
ncbi:methyl-accepting chemotaxis protein [Clostridium autoethanogenum]|uniref:Methyl-accepting chemotaxis protein n=1 Tax=Clostridium autoethanogenum TaxID=84023 RepID=A0A3M0SQW8_9CLOT|nr:methyl-accepting chemotaxis protein [Clostridium autoethanogenum]RMD00121.1 methyl-accepting chemotaxis protein [Clostridium autoethanogenum]